MVAAAAHEALSASSGAEPANLPPSVLDTPTSELLRRLELIDHPSTRRHAPGRLPRPRAGSRLRARRDPASTSPATTCAASTGTSPPASSQPHVRETIADRELETWVLVDLSASLDFGTADVPRSATSRSPPPRRSAFLTARTGNRIGAVDARRRGARDASRPAAAATTCTALLHRVVTAAQDRPRRRGRPRRRRCSRLSRHHERRGLAVVVSDFLDAGGWDRPAAGASPCATRCSPSRSSTRASSSCPTSGMIELVDPETGASASRSRPRSAEMRSRYAEAAADAARRHRPSHPRRRCRPPRAAHRPRLAARPRALRRLATRARSMRSRRVATMTFLAPLPTLAARRRRRARRRLRRAAAGAPQVRGAVHQPRPARRRSPRSDPVGVATSPAVVFLVRHHRARRSGFAQPARDERGARASGPRSSSPSTRRCRWRPPTSRPSRLEAAQAAAKRFLEHLPPKINVGLVSFNGNAAVEGAARPPTASSVARPSTTSSSARAPPSARPSSLSLDAIDAVPARRRGHAGPGPHRVDVATAPPTVGRPNDARRRPPSEADVPVSTIAFGTDERHHHDARGAATRSRCRSTRTALEDDRRTTPTARSTPRPARASSTQVYENIGSSVGFETEQREISTWFVGGALLLLIVSRRLQPALVPAACRSGRRLTGAPVRRRR